jgi:rRNA-processing protein FCF1
LRSRAYWRIYDLTESDARPYPLVEAELRAQQRRLNAAIAYLKRLKPFLDREGSIVVPDTSAFIQGLYFTDYEWARELGVRPLPVRLVVPTLVIEELEKLRSFDRGSARNRARSVLRDLRRLLVSVPAGQAVRLRDNVTIEALVDDDRHIRLENNDGEIIDQAVQVQALTGRDVTIVSLDLPMELRSRLRGVQVVTMPEKDVATVPAQPVVN